MDSHIFFSLCANQVFGRVAFIQRNPSFLIEKAEAMREVRFVVIAKRAQLRRLDRCPHSPQYPHL